jgi:hypothetical protein
VSLGAKHTKTGKICGLGDIACILNTLRSENTFHSFNRRCYITVALAALDFRFMILFFRVESLSEFASPGSVCDARARCIIARLKISRFVRRY